MIEKIIHNGIVIALIVRKNHKQDGVKFLCPHDYLLQLGLMTHPKGHRILPHIHNAVGRNTVGTQEVLFVKSGEIRINFYSPGKVFLKSRRLSAGDVVLLATAGHGIEVIRKAVIIEVKNGPYIEGADKRKFRGKEKMG